MRSRVRAHVFLVLLAPGAAVSACFYGWDLDDSAGTDGGGNDALADSGASDTTTNDGKPFPDGTSSEGSGGDASSDGPTPPPICVAPGPCGAGLSCIFPDHLCGKGAKGGACTKPAGAQCVPGRKELWCGCDGKLYPNECTLYAALTDLNASTSAGCAADAGYFQCGYLYCDRATQFCQAFPTASTFKCVDWSGLTCGGGVQDCSCAKMSCTAIGCSQPGTAGSPLTVTCQ